MRIREQITMKIEDEAGNNNKKTTNPKRKEKTIRQQGRTEQKEKEAER